MKEKILNRVFAALLCVSVFCTSFATTVFSAAVVGWWDEFFVQSAPLVQIFTEIAHDKNSNDFSKHVFCIAQWRKIIKQYNIPKDELRELFDICWNSDSNLFISKYGDSAYNNYFDDCQNLVKITISTMRTSNLDDVFNVELYGDNGAEFNEDNDVEIPVDQFSHEITNYPHLYKNLVKVSFRDEVSKNTNVSSQSFVKLYTDGVSCVGTDMDDGVYFLRYLYRDGQYYFSPYQHYFHREVTLTSDFEWFISPISMIGSDSFEMSCCSDYSQSTLSLGYSLYSVGSAIYCNDFINFSDETGSHLVGTPMDSASYDSPPAAWSDEFRELYTLLVDVNGNQCGFEHHREGWTTVHADNSRCPLFMQYSYWHLGGNDTLHSTSYSYPLSNLSVHDSKCSNNCDFGYYVSSFPLSLSGLPNVPSGSVPDNTDVTLDPSKLPNRYHVIINNDNSSTSGDTIYNYTIFDPETGRKDTIRNFVTNNYTFTTINNGDDDKDDKPSSGSINGNVTVGGRVDIGGNVGVDINVSVPDININVNSGNSSENPGDYIDPGDIDTNLDSYLEYIPEVSKGFIDYLKDFFAWLPPPVFGILMLGLVVAVWCRLAGR